MAIAEVQEAPVQRLAIKTANILDIDKLTNWLMSENIAEQSGIEMISPPEREAVKDTMFNYLGPNNAGIVWYSTFMTKDNKEVINGIFVLGEYSPWWTKQRCLYNTMYYVSPEYRSFGLGDEFLQRAIEVSKKLNVELIVGTTQFTDRVDILERYFRTKGFEKLGSTMLYTGG
jgi:L-amino acid N-acyltransferase YncA